MDRMLTIHEATSLAAIIGACQRNAVVTWEDKNDRDTGLAHGTMRAVCDERGNLFHNDRDVRDAHVWITTTAGFEWFPTLQHILDRYEEGLFALDMGFARR
jgi:hypothetical protein